MQMLENTLVYGQQEGKNPHAQLKSLVKLKNNVNVRYIDSSL